MTITKLFSKFSDLVNDLKSYFVQKSGDTMTGGISWNSGQRLYWKEGAYGDQFAIQPYFNGADDANLMKLQGAVGDINTSPALYDLMTVSGKSGNVWMKGSLQSARLIVKATTVGTNTYADANPKLIFQNADASQNASLTFTDYDSVQAPASLTLNGNQGGEYFIAPNIKATSKVYCDGADSTGAPGFYSHVADKSWSYLRLQSGSTYWDIATKSDSNSGGLDFRPAGASNKGPWINTAGMTSCANSGSTVNTDMYGNAAIQIREVNYAGANSDTWGVAPRLAWHWSGRVANQIGLASNGWLYANAGSVASSVNMKKIVLENGGSWNITANPASHSHTKPKVMSFSANYSAIAAGAMFEVTVNVTAQSGFTTAAVAGFNMGSRYLNVSAAYINGNTVKLLGRNAANAQAGASTATAFVLFIPN